METIFSQDNPLLCKQYFSTLGNNSLKHSAPTNQDSWFLDHCFLIFEQPTLDELEKEDVNMEDCLKYFFPSTVQKTHQNNVVSAAQAMMHVANDGFKDGEALIKVVEFIQSKMGLAYFGRLVFVLCVPQHVPNYLLHKQVDMLVNCCQFFHGPPEALEKQSSQSLGYIHQIGKELTELANSLIRHPNRVFEPIPYTELPLKQNSVFLTASQILDLCSDQSDYFGGCVLCDNSVLCNQMSEDLVQWMIYRSRRLRLFTDQHEISTESKRTSSNMSEMSFAVREMTQQSKKFQDPILISEEKNKYMNSNSHLVYSNGMRIDLLNVYLEKEVIDKLKTSIHATLSELSSEKDPSSIKMDEFTHREGSYLGLIVMQLSRVSLAALFEQEKLSDEQFFKKTIVKLQEQIQILNTKIVNMRQYYPSEFAVIDNIRVLNSKTPTPTSSSLDASQSCTLIFDEFNRMATGSVALQDEKVSDQFMKKIANMKDYIVQDKNVTKILLRNSYGDNLFTKKLFGSEIYHYIKSSKNSSINQLEKHVREIVRKEFQMNII